MERSRTPRVKLVCLWKRVGKRGNTEGNADRDVMTVAGGAVAALVASGSRVTAICQCPEILIRCILYGGMNNN